MKQTDTVIRVFQKYHIHAPIDKKIQKKMVKIRKRCLIGVFRSRKTHSIFYSIVVGWYYWFLRRGLELKLATAARLFYVSAVCVAFFFVAGTIMITDKYIKSDLPGAAEGYITRISGGVSIVRDGQHISAPELKGLVKPGDIIKTGKNNSLTFQSSNVIAKVTAGSEISIVSLSPEKENRFVVQKGTLFIRAARLRKGQSVCVQTHNALVHVRGTRFSVGYDNLKTIIHVQEGKVLAERLDPANGVVMERQMVESGKSVVISDRIIQKKSTKLQVLRLKRISLVPVIDDVKTYTRHELENESLKVDEQERALDRQLNREHLLKVLPEGKMSTFTLYDGRTIKGRFRLSGDRYRIYTAAGIVAVDAKDIQKIE